MIIHISFQGSEEVFSVEPLPPRTQSPDQVSESSPYIPHSSRVEINEPDSEAPGDRDDEEMLPVDMEEVCLFWFLAQCYLHSPVLG